MFVALRRVSAYLVVMTILVSVSSSQTKLSLKGVPSEARWLNTPQSWKISDGNVLTIASSKKTDWFVDPFDGTVSRNAPLLLFSPDPDYVLSTQVVVKFAAKWDAGALMLWGDDHHWAKLSFELSPDGKPTLVTVVTRGSSDDCNSSQLAGDSVFLRIAKSSKTYIFYYSTDGNNCHILRTFDLGSDLPIAVGFESQSPAGAGSVATFSAISYEKIRLGNIYK
jgi:hypothetical protein